MKQLIILFSALIFIGGSCAFPFQKPEKPIACTLEAKICPDGSAVGRTGPNCEFAPCPPIPLQKCGGSTFGSCSDGYRCIQECGPPVARDTDPPPPYYCERNDIADKPRPCPICLASNTVIATPNGNINVRDLRVGQVVWSLDEEGHKIASKVIKTSRNLAPKSHKVIHLTLSDKRQIWISPEHPTSKGTPVRDLLAGDAYDGAVVLSSELVPYWDEATYDLWPEGPSGLYWANGILIGSTLDLEYN